MNVLQAPSPPPVPTWSRGAIHDTVAAIVRQPPYRRNLGTTLLDRIAQWIRELFERLVGALGGVPHGRVIATVAAAIAALLILARIVYAARLRGAAGGAASATGVRAGRSTNLWSEAEQLAASGRFTEAAHALYRAVLGMLAASGLVRLHESKTSGDYSRELRGRGASSYAAFRRFGARYDRVIYGTGVCDAEGYRALLDDAGAILAGSAGERAA
jgi:Domain of unknown function (DUF4129)